MFNAQYKIQTNVHLIPLNLYYYEVDESFASQCCTLCGVLSKEYDKKRTKNCPCCGIKIDRDVNGSRNIYLKSICSMPGMKARLVSLQHH